MIRFTNVCMTFHGRPVLKDFTMEVPSGHTVVILGGSGGGKTTVLRLILGLLRPDSGSIRVDGKDIVGLPERNMVPIRARMAMVFQGSALFDSLTVRENVGYRLYEQQALSDDIIERLIVLSLCFVGLEDTLEKMPAELSGGMRKRVAIARALACSPEVILYDEPTAGLDPINTHLINELICRLQKEQRLTQVVVTHDLDTAYRVADRLIMLHRGEKLFDGTVDMLKTADDPRIRAFLRPHEILATPGCFPDKDGGIRVVAPTMDEETPA